jgi:hypothetical protein
MADTIRRVDYFYVEVPDRPGEGFRFLSSLKEAGVNLLSLTAFPIGGGRSQIDVVPEDPAALEKAAKKAGITFKARRQALFVQGKDRPGAVADLARRLSDAGINIHSANAACGGGGGFGMILWVAQKDLDAAAKALGA